MNFELFKEYEPLYIIGHKNPDIDSIASTILLTSIFKKNGVLAIPTFLNEGYDIDETNKNICDDCLDLNMTILDINDLAKKNFILVDHNDPTQSIGFGKRIVWGIDHHKSSGILNNMIIKDFCSCSLLIYDKFKDIYEFTNEEKFMIYMANLDDTLYFKGSKYDEKYKDLIDSLGYDLDVEKLFKKYFVVTDLSLGVDPLFENITKSYNYKGIKFDSVVVKTYNEYEYLKQEFINKMKEKDAFLGIWIDFEKEISYSYFWCNGELHENIYDFIASRASTVIPEVYKIIDSFN